MTSTARMIGVVAAKGGIGQSMIALEWAQTCGRRGQRCLLVEVAGGDLAWMVGATPTRFAEDVAADSVALADAIVRIDDSVDMLAAGNTWAVYGPSQESATNGLLTQIGSGGYDAIVFDLGHASPDVTAPIWHACNPLAAILQDDIASVARAYALLRRLNDLGLAEHLSLVFNRMSSKTQVDSLKQRFDQLTHRFLGRTWPRLGTIPDGPKGLRMEAIASWGSGASPAAQGGETALRGQIIKPALFADNKG